MVALSRRHRAAGIAGLLLALLVAATVGWRSLSSPAPAAEPTAEPTAAAATEADATRAPTRQIRGWVADERGLPIMGALVSVVRTAAATPGALTDKQGAFRLTVLKGVPVDLEFSAPLHMTVVAREIADAADRGALHIVLDRSATVAGRVRTPDGDAVEGADVEIAGTGLWPSRTALTAADGSYRFEGLPGGLYALRATTEVLVSDSGPVVGVEPGEADTMDLILLPAAAIEMRVIDAATGDAIDGAEVSVGELDSYLPPMLLATDAGGIFRAAPLPATPHRVSVSAPGFVAAIGVSVTPSNRVKPLRLRRAGVLAGRVVDSAGRGVPGAQLEVIGSSRGKPIALSRAVVHYQAALQLGQTGGPPPLLPVDNLGVVPGPVPPIPLFAAAPIRAARGPAPAATTDSAPGFHTDARGEFRIAGVPGGKLRIVVRDALHASTATPLMTLLDGDRREDIEVVMLDGFVLTGRVLDADGNPVAATRLSIETPIDPLPRSTLTDAQGHFTIGRLLGACTLTAHPPGQPTQRRKLTLEGGDREIEIRLTSQSHVARGRVFDPRGFPLEGALVTLEQGSGDSHFRVGLPTAADGSFEAAGLPPPPYRLRVTHRGHAPAVRTYLDATGSELSIKMETGRTMRVQVLDAISDEGVVGATLRYAHKSGQPRGSARSQLGGLVEIHELSAGDYTINIKYEHYVSAEITVVVGEGDELTRVLLEATGSASGDVVDSIGAPVYDALVTLVNPGAPVDWGKATRTDHAGHFRLAGLSAGPVRLTARHQSAGTVILDRPIEVRARADAPGAVLRLPDRAPGFEPVTAADTGGPAPIREGVQARVEMRRGKITVSFVAPGSGAHGTGLRVGDVVTHVDGEKVFAAGQVRSMWVGDAGTRVGVTVRRGGKPRRLKLTRGLP